MSIVSVLQKYSEITLGEELRGPILGTLYKEAEKYIRYVYLDRIYRTFLFDLFPRRGLIIPLEIFSRWLGRFDVSRVEIISPGSFLSRILKGPGYESFGGWFHEINRTCYYKGDYFILGLIQSFKDSTLNMQVFPNNEGYILPYDKYARNFGRDCPLWDLLPSEIRYGEASSIHVKYLDRRDDLCVYVGNYAVIFKFKDDIVLIYGILDLTTSKWVFNEKYEQVKTLYKYENKENNYF